MILPLRFVRGLLPVLPLLLLVAGCGHAEEQTASVGGPALPTIEGPDSPSWSPTPTADDPAVATVNGVPVVRSQLERALADEGPDATPADVLDRLIALEVLAQQALASGYYRPAIVEEIYEQGLVRELIADRFLRKPPESFFNDELVRHIYYDPRFRMEFDHVDAFKVADAQFICCPKRFDECKVEDFEACMAEEEPHVREVFADLKTLESPDVGTFADRVRQWEGQYRRLGLKTYDFFYNVNLPHEEQGGYDIINENVATAAASVAAHEIAQPVRSRNGWHIIYLVKHDAEEHRGPEDPEVRATIIKGALPARQKAEYAAWMQALHRVHNVEMHTDNLQVFFKGMRVAK